MGTAAAPHVNFLQFSQNGKPSGVQSAIGYPIEVLECAWSKYGSRLIRAVYRYPGFRVVARSRNRLKLGERVAESLYNGGSGADAQQAAAAPPACSAISRP